MRTRTHTHTHNNNVQYGVNECVSGKEEFAFMVDFSVHYQPLMTQHTDKKDQKKHTKGPKREKKKNAPDKNRAGLGTQKIAIKF